MSMHRVAAVVFALAAMAVSGCASDVTGSPVANSSAPSTTSAARLDCLVDAPGRTGVDAAFDDLGPFTVTPICPADAIWVSPEVSAEFHELNAAEISENGKQIMRVLVGQVNSGTGEEFKDQYFSELSAAGAKLNPPKILAAGPPKDIGGYSVQYFHMYMSAEGYAFVDGPTVVIAERFASGTYETVEDLFVKILNNLHSVQ
jgi:hypothetical protein